MVYQKMSCGSNVVYIRPASVSVSDSIMNNRQMDLTYTLVSTQFVSVPDSVRLTDPVRVLLNQCMLEEAQGTFEFVNIPKANPVHLTEPMRIILNACMLEEAEGRIAPSQTKK